MPTISTLTVDVESRTSGFSQGLKVATAGLAALAAGAAYAFGQFEESEQIARQTDAVLKSTGHSANVTAQAVSELANALAEKSGIDDEAIQTGENMLLTFKNIQNVAGQGNDIFNQTTQAVLDMSVAMGQDMKSSAIQVGKALNDPIAGMSALMRVGVQFTEQQKEQITGLVEHGKLLEAQKIILGELSSEFAGSAEAQATATGKMKVALGNLAETVGGLLAPAFQALAEILQKVIAFFQDNVGPAFKAVSEWAQGVWEKVKPLAEIVGGALVDAWHALVGAVKRLLPDLAKLWEALQPILKVVGLVIAILLILAAKILGPVITAIGFLIDIQVKLFTAVAQAYDKIIGWIEKLIDWFSKIPEAVGKFLGRVNDMLGGWPGKILAAVGDLGHILWNVGRAIITGLWDGMKSVWESVTNWLGGLGNWIQGLKGPMSKDKVLLKAQGAAIIGGLQAGMEQGWKGVKGTLGGFNADLAGASFAVGGSRSSWTGGDVVLQVDGQTFARITRDQLLKLSNRNAGTGL